MRTRLLFPYIRAVVLAGFIAVVALICMAGTAQANQSVGDAYAKEVSDAFGFSLATADASGDDVLSLSTFDLGTPIQFGATHHIMALEVQEGVLAADTVADALYVTVSGNVEILETAIVSDLLKEDIVGDIAGRSSRLDYRYLA